MPVIDRQTLDEAYVACAKRLDPHSPGSMMLLQAVYDMRAEAKTTICAWHPGFDPQASKGESHGLCSHCAARELRQP